MEGNAPSSIDEPDARWRALADGTLSEADVAALREEAGRSEEGRTLFELYRPFDPNEKQRLFERVRTCVHEDARRRTRHRIGGGALVLAAAAGSALLYARRPAQQVEVAESGSYGPGVDAPVERLETPDAELRLTFYPVRPIAEKLEVRGAVLVHGGRAVPWDPRPNPTSPDNKVRIVGAKKDLFPCLEAGEWRIIVALGVAGPAPSESDLLRLADQKSAGSFQVRSKRIWLDGLAVGRDGRPCRG